MQESALTLLCLPVEVLRGNLLCFLAQCDVSRLDVACCNKKAREGYLSVVMGAVVENSNFLRLEYCIIKWSFDRQCYFRKFVGCSDTDLVEEQMSQVLRHCTDFESKERKSKDLSDEQLEQLLRCCPSLQFLRVRVIRIAPTQHLRSIAQHCGGLQKLHLHHTDSLNDEHVKLLVKNCPRLREFTGGNCFSVSSGGIEAMARGWHCLTALSLDQLALEDRFLRTIGDHCKDLTRIDLGACHEQISDDTMVHLAERCVNLRTVHILPATNLTDIAVEALARHCPSLTNLQLHGAPLITSASLAALGAHCPGLLYLELPDCPRLDDGGVVALAEGCPELLYVIISGCALVTDVGIACLAEKCQKLRCLDVAKCPLITDAAVEAIAGHSPAMRLVYAPGCPKITPQAVAILKAKRPAFRVVTEPYFPEVLEV